ncbi:MAG: TIGR01777 family oxidoreductase [Thermodesulfobacteriota bacterium]
MKILVSGSSGLIGSALTPYFINKGHNVSKLIRKKLGKKDNEIYWEPQRNEVEASKLEGFDVVVHLSGENVFGLWTSKKKQEIKDSRVKSTTLLCDTLSKLERKPRLLACASAIGFYGDRGDEVLTEVSKAGTGFLAEVTKKWESATEVATTKGIRVVNLRIGAVISSEGGALQRMLLPFQLGLGGRVGSGKQYISWISIDDVCGSIHHAVVTDTINGPLNIVSPNPVTNLEFVKTLGRVLNRPTFFPIPSFILKSLFFELAKEVLLTSTRVKPSKLLTSGYKFQYPVLEGTLRHILDRY